MAGKTNAENTSERHNINDDIDNEAVGKSKKEKVKKQKKKKEGGKLAPILVLIVVVGFLVGVFGFNLLDIREKYMRSFLEKIPIVNNLLPPAVTPESDEYGDKTREELIAQIKQMQETITKNEDQLKSLGDRNLVNIDELARLQEIEAQHLQFKTDKEEFDRLIANNDPDAYAKFFEKISPENAEVLYQEAVASMLQSKDLKKYVNMFATMDETSAAQILEQLMTTDMDTVVLILRNISSEQSGMIIAAMDPKNGASVTKRMAPVS